MAHVDFSAELTINDRWVMDADVRARMDDRGEIYFCTFSLPHGGNYQYDLQEEPVYFKHPDPLACLIYDAARAAWECNPHLQQELEEKLFDEERGRQEIACEAEYERRTGYHDVAA